MEHEFESYDIDITRIKNSDKVCWEYTKNPPNDDEEWFEATEDMFYKLSPKTEALAASSEHVRLSLLKASNILEWYYRLEALFDAGVAFLYTDTVEGEIPIRLSLSDLKDHLGLRIGTSNWDSSKFDRSVRHLRMQNCLRELL